MTLQQRADLYVAVKEIDNLHNKMDCQSGMAVCLPCTSTLAVNIGE